MFYQEYEAPGILKNYIRCIWIQEYNEKTGPGLTKKEKILPDGCVELVFHYGKPFKTYFPDQSFEIQPQGFIVTQMNHWIEIQPGGPIGIIAVRFFPWGAYRFLSAAIKELHDRVIDVNLLWHQQTRDVQDKIREARSHAERFRVVEDFLYSRLEVNRLEDTLVDQCLKNILYSRGSISLKSLYNWCGISQRQLQRRFVNAAGASPKHFVRITRFLNVCKHIRMRMKQESNIHLTHITQEFGYFDQSHFIKEFKGFSGVTPGEFISDTGISFVEV